MSPSHAQPSARTVAHPSAPRARSMSTPATKPAAAPAVQHHMWFDTAPRLHALPTRPARQPSMRSLLTGELLDAMVARVGDVDVPGAINRYAGRGVELPIRAAKRAPLGEEATRVRELLDAVVARVDDVHVPARVDRD